MTIAIFANPIIQEKAGVGRICHNLVRAMLKEDTRNNYLLLANFGRNYYQNRQKLEKFVKETGSEKTQIYISRLPEIIRNWLSGTPFPMRFLYPGNIDIYLALFPTSAHRNGFKRQITIIYDLVFAKFGATQGEKFSRYYQKRTQLAGEKSQKLICISESTKKDLIKFFSITKDKVEVVYPAAEPFLDIAKRLPEELTPKKYILAVGTIEPRKNLTGLFSAYASLPEKLQNEFPLVICGAKGWQTGSIYERIKSLGLEEKVKFLGYTSDAVLARLYCDAAVFCYPSLYEGFGLPIIEAMQFGTPVITSNTSSMPEAGGKAAIYINPESPKELAEKLNQVLTGKIERSILGKLGKEQASKFSWEKSARKTIEIIENIS